MPGPCANRVRKTADGGSTSVQMGPNPSAQSACVPLGPRLDQTSGASPGNRVEVQILSSAPTTEFLRIPPKMLVHG